MSYTLLKMIHVSCALLSITGFALRGWLKLHHSQWLAKRWVKTLPHVVDTLLLASAFGLAHLLQLSPHLHSWLAAKITALIIYIGLGIYLMRFAHSRRQQWLSYLVALTAALYIVAVAQSRNPLPFIALG